mgnify:CR=1 FL=1
MTEEIENLVSAYLYLSKEVLPKIARSRQRNWPVSEDHCFQRIVLDHVCGGVWHEYLDRPAYKNLTKDQARRAVKLCEDIADGHINLQKLNQQSLIWRDRHRRT